jgi:hypothetical protein
MYLYITTPVYVYRPHLWSSGQSFRVQIRKSGFDSRRYQIFWEVVGLERGPLILVSTTEELLERNSSGSGLESREYGHRFPSRWPCGTLYSQKLELTSPTSGGLSVGIVRSWTQIIEFSFSIRLSSPGIFMLESVKSHRPTHLCSFASQAFPNNEIKSKGLLCGNHTVRVGYFV